jgi:hypothetical protein
MQRHRIVILLLAIGLLSQSTSAPALVKFDFEQKFFSDPPEPVLDHYLLEKDGVYHLFYLRGNPALSIGHATSTDLKHWTYKTPVLSPGTWDTVLWAPHIFTQPTGSTFLMYFTGVNNSGAQQAGVAFSNDLAQWVKYPDPIYHPDPVWAEWDTDTWCHGRDPHVISYNGQYYMFNTAKTWMNQGAVACAVSSDLIHWEDLGPIYVHYTWHVMESIFVMERNNRFHMFFTEQAVNGTSHMSSDSLLSGWDVISNRRIIDTGHAPQVSTLADGTEIFSRHSIYNDNRGTILYTIRLDTLRWSSGDIPYPYRPFPLAEDWSAVSGTAFTFQPTYLNNPYARGEDVEPTYEGDCWIGTKERYNGPLGFGTPGGTVGEEATGVLRSRTFTIDGYSMTLLVGGTNDPASCYVALVNANTGVTLCKETGKGVEEMDQRLWDLQPLVGKEAYIEIVDQSSTGHINVDYIVESANPATTPQGDGRTTRKPGLGGVSRADGSPDAVKTAAESLTSTPNPFNPATTISFELAEPARASVRVYDVSGTLVRTLASRDFTAGTHTLAWDGTSGDGRAMASGIYFCRLVVDGNVVATRKMMLLK